MAINQASLDRFRSPTDSRSHPNKPGGGCAFRCHSARSISGGACSSGAGAARFRPLLRSLAGVFAGDLAGVFAGDLAGDLAGVFAGDFARVFAAAALTTTAVAAAPGDLAGVADKVKDALGALAGDALVFAGEGALAGEAFRGLAGDAFGVLAPPALLGEAALCLEGMVDRGSVLKAPLMITRSALRSCHFTSPSA